MLHALPLLAILCSPSAQAGMTLSGTQTEISYGDNGTWNWSSSGTGFRANSSFYGDWVDVTFPGTPFNLVGYSYTNSSGTFANYSYYYESAWTVTTEEDLSGTGVMVSYYEWTIDDLAFSKTETWFEDGQTVQIWFTITNTSSEDMTDLAVVDASDPDQDYDTYYDFSTLNDVRADGHWAQAVGPTSGLTVGYGVCDPDHDTVGSNSSWSYYPTDPLTDYNGAAGDNSVAWVHSVGTLAAGETTDFGTLFIWADSDTAAQTAYDDGMAAWCCDVDADGVERPSCGGTDCDDLDPTIYTGAPETWYDGIDQDCAGDDDYDADADGHDSSAYHGDDCNDADATVYPGATDTWYDGIDSDCAGNNDYDADGDGVNSSDYDGADCNDADPTIRPGAPDTWYDGVDSDCAGNSDYDADGDGSDSVDYGGDDCNDADATIHPGAADTWYDGIDSDCAGNSDYDADADGHDSVDYGGDDCDDSNATVYPGAPELPDGLDNDCNGHDETYDRDKDGLTDIEEGVLGTDPTLADTDGDGLSDGEEVHTTHTDPLLADTDEGGVSDGDEITNGTNPLDPSDDMSSGDGGADGGADGGSADGGSADGGTDTGAMDGGATDTGTGGKDKGCGCASSPGGPKGAGLASFALFGLALLRRRKQR